MRDNTTTLSTDSSDTPAGSGSVEVGHVQKIAGFAGRLTIAGVLIAIGWLIGWYLANWLDRSQMQADLGNATQRTLLRLDAIIAEAEQVFSDLDTSPHEHCSEALLLEGFEALAR